MRNAKGLLRFGCAVSGWVSVLSVFLIVAATTPAGAKDQAGGVAASNAESGDGAAPMLAQASRSSRLIREIQQGLGSLGYRVGRADGIYGPATRRAIQAFQRDNRMRVTGNVSYALYQRIQSKAAARRAPRRRSRPQTTANAFARPGFFVGGSANYYIDMFTGDLQEVAAPFGLTADVEDTFGGSARIGYRFNEWFAADANFEWISGFSILFNGAEFFELGGYSGTLNASFIAPLGRVEPYVRLGIGATVFDFRNVTGLGLDFENSDLAVTGRVAVGVQVHLMPNLALNAEAAFNANSILLSEELSSGSISMANYVSVQLGFMVKF